MSVSLLTQWARRNETKADGWKQIVAKHVAGKDLTDDDFNLLEQLGKTPEDLIEAAEEVVKQREAKADVAASKGIDGKIAGQEALIKQTEDTAVAEIQTTTQAIKQKYTAKLEGQYAELDRLNGIKKAGVRALDYLRAGCPPESENKLRDLKHRRGIIANRLHALGNSLTWTADDERGAGRPTSRYSLDDRDRIVAEIKSQEQEAEALTAELARIDKQISEIQSAPLT